MYWFSTLVKKQKATINPKNEDDRCFLFAANFALNHEEIKWNRERVSNIKPFINKYKWEEISYPSKLDDWKKFEKNNLTIALNILYIKKKICRTYISKRNLTCEKQIILLMITNEEKKEMKLTLKGDDMILQ